MLPLFFVVCCCVSEDRAARAPRRASSTPARQSGPRSSKRGHGACTTAVQRLCAAPKKKTDLAEEPGVADVRVLGAIGVVEMEREVNMAAATAAAVEQGVWLRPFGRLIYITADEVTQMCRGVRAAVAGGRQ